ncbi:MAG TPA: SRPBCC family protein [Acidobacteriaceae bacterium]|nr:SRPBCC family protein [Acidobacteriaceae bacterium]
MQTIILETQIAAPPERCFLLSLNIDLHMAGSGERAIGGVTHGIIGPGQTVTWQGRHFGMSIAHQSLIARYERPHHFQDVMVKGMFRSFAHDHFFEQKEDGGTRMRDELRFSAPLGLLGGIAERLVLRRYLTRFLRERNGMIRRTAEDRDLAWQLYLKDS